MEYWSGTKIDKLDTNEIFVYGANPEFRNGAGGAKAAVAFGAKVYGSGRGIVGNTIGIITKNLIAGYKEAATGIVYPLAGECSVSPEMIRANIDEFYKVATEHSDKKFLISYQFETYPNGAPKKSLNGYTSQEMLEMFVRPNIPANIVFHDSYQPHIEKLLNKDNTMTAEYTYFFHLTSPFSNFHPAKFEYKELTFISNEQFMMYSKAKNFKDEASAAKILELNATPIARDFIDGKITREQIVNNKDWADEWNKLMMSVKKLGRGVQNYDDVVWTNKREKIVLFGARLKFSQNEDLKQILLNTGNTIMVEASPYDKIWGIGLSAADAKKTDPTKWPGLNLLGHVLDTLKLEFQNNLTTEVNKKKALSNSPIEVLNFYHLNKIIPEDGEYIGRANKNFNLTQSLFANPFPVYKPEERGSSIGKFTDWLWKQIADNNITKDDLLGLAGKKLVCYCKPKACHGDVLKETVELLINNEPEFDRRVEEIRANKTKMKP